MNKHGISLFIRFCEDKSFMLIYVTILLEFSIAGEKHGDLFAAEAPQINSKQANY